MMDYLFSFAKETKNEDLFEYLKYDTIQSFFFIGTEKELENLRSKALGIARRGQCIITSSKFVIDGTRGITFRYGGKIHKRKKQHYGIQKNS